MCKFPILVVTVVSITTLLAFAFAEDAERRQIVAVRVKTPPKIDGILNDAVWEKAQLSEGFIQTKPNRGKRMNQQTTVSVLYDDDNLYFGFQCYDTEPEKILGTEMRRDYEVWETNDYIRFVVDTYHDLRNGYYFGTNPLGAKVDARVTDNGKGFYMSWDAVWDCAAKRNPQGWAAEFSIPFGQLRFPNKDKHIWGFNCGRTIRRTDEEGCWSSIEIDNVNVLSGAGELAGLETLPQGHRLEVRPIAVLGAEVNYDGETDMDIVKKPSLDIKYGLTSGLTLDATVNTDFAQVEADEERVNLSRFDPYLEEKRPFFLEGVGIFDTPMSLFYSRRIGSSGDKEAQILGGLKLTGKVGKQSLGLLSVQTDEVDEIPLTNFSAFRIQRDILRSSSAGIIFLNKSPWEGERDNQTFGADLRFNPRDELSISGLLAKTWTHDLKNDLAGQISGNWQAESWDMGASYKDIQENFNAEMGFMDRTDIRGADLWGGKSFQIRKGIFRSVGGGAHYGIITDHDGRLKGRDLGFEYGLELETGDSGGIGAEQRWDYLEGDWEIREGIVIPKGLYRWYGYGAGAGTEDSRWLKIGGEYSRNGFYTGDRQSASLNGHIRPMPKLLLTGSYNWNHIELPDGSFSTNTINSRTIYTFSPDFFIKLFLQWNDDSDVIRGNFLLRYTYRPGSDFYIVYNELWQNGDVEQRSIVAKLTYFLNL